MFACIRIALLLLLSHFSHVRLCATPETVGNQAPLSLGFSRQEHWSGLPFPSPIHEREKWKSSHSVVSDSYGPHGLQPTGLLCPWNFPGKSTRVGCHCLLRELPLLFFKTKKTGPHPRVSYWIGLVWSSRLYIFNMFPGVASEVVCAGTTLGGNSKSRGSK